MKLTPMRCFVARTLIVTMCSTFIPRAEGAVIGTDSAINADRERILILLERPEVAAQLEGYGVRMSDAKARIAALTDTEVAKLSADIDEAYAGGRVDPITLMGMAIITVILLPFFLVGLMVYNIVTGKGGGPGEYDTSKVHKP